jgi:sterol desaturase/sphingolipid hydroxylase (fatty acid hydroxylase superfamily)
VGRRWGGHAFVYGVSAVASSVAFRIGAVGMAAIVAKSRFGLLNRPWMPWILRAAFTVVLLDLIRYLTHRVFHAVGFLWRIHEVHHSDPDYDVSTAVRFHPFEVMLDQAIFLAGIAMLAPPPAGVFTSELLSTAVNLFSHANASLPGWVERLLSRAIVTPDIHRVHHSEEISEQSRNFGQTFPWWDWLFGTFQAGERGRVFPTGVKELRDGNLGVRYMLRAPFESRR